MERPSHELRTHTDTCWTRVGAVIIDAIIVTIVTGSITALLTIIAGNIAAFASENPARSASLPSGLGAILTFVYFTYLEANYGQTFGKKLLSIVVVTKDGGPCETSDAVVRNLLRFVDALPVLYLLGAIVIFVTDDDQRIGDLAADTVVARVQKD